MSTVSTYTSRSGKLNYSAEEIYNFVTDARNFKRFIPVGSVSDLKIEKDYCSFRLNMLGEVRIHINERIFPAKVVFAGSAQQVNDFSLILDIQTTGQKKSEVNVVLSAEMSPFLKMIADEPVKQFLGKLIQEMEKFTEWNATCQDI